MLRNRSGNTHKGPEHNRFKHGMSRTSTYKSWSCMKARCFNKNNSDYPNWGGRGISVCEDWLIFENFLRDMGEKPAGYTIERLDVNAGYSKSNCVWADRVTQGRNRTFNKIDNAGAKSLLRKREGGADYAALSQEFGLSISQVGRICRGEAWA